MITAQAELRGTLISLKKPQIALIFFYWLIS
jgi:hypothetical protein